MRTTLSRSAVATVLGALAALSPSPAGAAGAYMLRVGADYQQNTTWAVTGERSSIPRLDVDLGLNAGGDVGGTGFLDWGGDAQYRRTTVNGNDAVQDRYSYGLRSTLFSAPGMPVTFTGYASRRDESFSTEGVAAGSIEGNSYGGGVTIRGTGARPWLQGNYGYSQDDSTSNALGKTSRTLQTLQATTAFGASAFSYNASYRGNYSGGTFETDRFADHRVDVNADATVAPSTKLRLNSLYFVRDTGTVSAISPRQESEAVTATLIRSPVDGLQQSAGYGYNRATQLTSGSDVARLQHQLNYAVGGQLPAPEWHLRVGGGASFDEDRQGTTTTRTASQSLSAFLAWRRAQAGSVVELHGGPTVGVLEPQGAAARVGYGATAGVSHNRSASIQTGFGYDATYASDVGDQGWSLLQSASGSANLRMGLASLSATLQLSAERRQTPLFGSTYSRSATAMGGWRLRTTHATVQIGFQEGATGKIPVGGAGDGLFIAPAFDSRTGYVQLGAGTLLGRMQTGLRARYSSVDLPDRPAYGEYQLQGSIDYAYGALRIGVEDTYVVTDVVGGRYRVNQFMVRAYRVFGSRF